jgi:hypothetical protein
MIEKYEILRVLYCNCNFYMKRFNFNFKLDLISVFLYLKS